MRRHQTLTRGRAASDRLVQHGVVMWTLQWPSELPASASALPPSAWLQALPKKWGRELRQQHLPIQPHQGILLMLKTDGSPYVLLVNNEPGTHPAVKAAQLFMTYVAELPRPVEATVAATVAAPAATSVASGPQPAKLTATAKAAAEKKQRTAAAAAALAPKLAAFSEGVGRLDAAVLPGNRREDGPGWETTTIKAPLAGFLHDGHSEAFGQRGLNPAARQLFNSEVKKHLADLCTTGATVVHLANTALKWFLLAHCTPREDQDKWNLNKQSSVDYGKFAKSSSEEPLQIAELSSAAYSKMVKAVFHVSRNPHPTFFRWVAINKGCWTGVFQRGA